METDSGGHFVLRGAGEKGNVVVVLTDFLHEYQPQYEVGGIARDGLPKYATINRPPRSSEVASVYKAALAAGLRRFDERRERLSPL